MKGVLALFCETAMIDADSLMEMIRDVYKKYKNRENRSYFLYLVEK